MKKILLLISAVILLTGCTQQSSEISQKIENLKSYSELNDEDKQRIQNCDIGINIPPEETKKLNLTNQKGFNIIVFASPNNKNISNEKFQTYVSECQFWEGVSPLKATSKILFWFQDLACGYEVDEFWNNATPESKYCNKIMEKLKNYKNS